MTNQIARLTEWMQNNHFEAKELSRRLGYVGDHVTSITLGKKRVGRSFLWNFSRVFGTETCMLIFGMSLSGDYMTERNLHPEALEAHKAISRARSQGSLAVASEYLCVSCGNQAHEWHHESYAEDQRLNVIPLCRSCHRRVTRGTSDVARGLFDDEKAVMV